MSADTQGAGFAPATYSRALAPQGGRAAGYAAGYATGYAAGSRVAAQAAEVEAARTAGLRAAQQAQHAVEQQAALEVLARAAQAAAARTTPVLAEAELAVHAAALELAVAVLGSELDDAPRAARAALARVREHPLAAQVQVIRLHPRDLATLRDVGLDVAPSDETAGVPAGARLVADPSLAPGDAIGEHPDGYLDATIASALDRARAALAELAELERESA